MRLLGVIGGTGFEKFFKGIEVPVSTPFGTAHMILTKGEKIAFVSRHGPSHSVPPHKINHKANIFALKKLGARRVLALNACGAISKYEIGDLVLLEDFIDLRAPQTYFDKLDSINQHAWMAPAFSPELQGKIVSAAKKTRVALKRGGVVFVAAGPRFETPAEIKAFGKLGANLVGMTTSPEAILSRELGLEYAAIAVVSNYAAGIKPQKHSGSEMSANTSAQSHKLAKIVAELSK